MEPPPLDQDCLSFARTLRERVFERRPILGAIVDKLGHKSLLEYVRGYMPVHLHPVMTARREEFLQTFASEVGEMFSPAITEKAVRQMRRQYYASTNDHHGPINAFDCFNAHVILALSAIEDPSPDRTEAIILLSCSNVSLNNISFPRGILYSASTSAGISAERLALLPSKSSTCSLYGYRAYEKADATKLLTLLQNNVRDGLVSPTRALKIEYIIRNILGDPAVLARKTYSAQASIINGMLWDTVFQGQQNAPSLISLGQERLTSRLLLDHHLGKDTLLSRIFFRPEYERMVLQHFDGIYGAFSHADQSGTYFFWGRNPETGRRSRMRRQETSLVSDDGVIVIPWNAESLAQSLRERQIMPSMLCVFCTIAFYYGVKCLGGYSQVNYLTYMKQAFMMMCRAVGEDDMAEACDPVATKNWSGFSFTYIEDGHGAMAPAQFLDLYLHADRALFSRLKDYAHVCTIGQAVEPILPEIYRYSYAQDEREMHLLTVTPEELMKSAGVRACLKISR